MAQMGERPTIYESAARRRRRRVRGALIGALVVVLLVAALAVAAARLRDGGGSRGRDGGRRDAVAVTFLRSRCASRGSADLEVHRGETATVRYRVIGHAGATASVTLVVSDAAGQQVKARRLTTAAQTGKWLEAAVPIDLEPGRYTYELRLGDGAAPVAAAARRRAPRTSSPAPVTASASLRVLPPLPPGFPGKKAVAAAREWISGRDGDVAFAVVDTNGADAGGYREHEPFQLASLSKAIMLVASLRDDPTPDATTEATLTRMITESDNGAAYTIFGQVGAKGMRAVAKDAGMQDYEQGSGWVDTPRVGVGRGALLLAARVAGARRGAQPRAAAALERHPHPALGHPRRRRPRGLDELLQGRLARPGQQAHGPGGVAREGQEEVGPRGDERREPHALVRLGHAEGRHRAAAGAGAHARVSGRRAGVTGVAGSPTGAP